MKKWIITVAFIIAFGGFAAAQGNPTSDPSKKTGDKKEKKGTVVKKGNSAKENQKKDSTVKEIKILLPPFPIDTVTTVPKTKKDD